MKTIEGNYVMCSAAGKIATLNGKLALLSTAVKSIFIWVAGTGLNLLMVIIN